MRKALSILVLIISCNLSNGQTAYDFETLFEKSNGLETATYQQTIQFYSDLAEVYSGISIKAIGETDSGEPLHLVTLNLDAVFDFSKIKEHNKQILLINNGIHPGESDGIDATMILFRDIVQGKIEAPKETVLATIPIYNVGGSLNRNSKTRTNQNGPKEYGFRGNARNYDLNRDFIKSDTKNSRTFAEIFHLIKPDVFIDNHVSNGADYQYTLTHVFTQHNKMGNDLGNYIHTEMIPTLTQKLLDKNWEITPYVNVFNQVPEEGFSQFMDYPRYSTGYATLFNSIGVMVETHMLKPYKQRVEGTYEFMKSMIDITEEQGDKISELRNNALANFQSKKTYPLDWTIDTTKTTTLNFKGFEGHLIESKITGAKRLKYDRTKPFTKKVSYQNYFKPSLEVEIPDAYIIPGGWHNVTELLKLNAVEMYILEQDSTITVESYKIEDYKTRQMAFEGHYLHYNVNVSKNNQNITFKKGDVIIKTAQPSFRYIIETLEPQAPDSFFNWNFFDTILQQKEWFSPYVWEDLALKILNENPKLKDEFEEKKKNEKDFSDQWYYQLDWIHKQSKYYEKSHLQYPIYRLK